METMKIPPRAIALLMSGELDRWTDLDTDDFLAPRIGELYGRLGVDWTQRPCLSLGISAATWRKAQAQGSPYTDQKMCSFGHDWCVPFGGFHLVVVEDEDE